MGFLPKNYSAPTGSSDYMKFQEGENRIRILTDAVIGWEGWKDNKPFRRKGIEKNIEDSEVDMDQKYKKPKINHFWAMVVWDYAEKKLKILTITQKSVMKAIDGLVNDSDWGDPKEYDISIAKIITGPRTAYAVKAYPPKKVSADIASAFKTNEIDLEKIFGDSSDAELNELAG